MVFNFFVSTLSKRVFSCFAVLVVLLSCCVPCLAADKETLIIPAKPTVRTEIYPYWSIFKQEYANKYYIIFTRDKVTLYPYSLPRYGDSPLFYLWDIDAGSSEWVSVEKKSGSLKYISYNYDLVDTYNNVTYPEKDETYFVESVRSTLNAKYDVDDTLWYGSSFDGGGSEDNTGILSGLSSILSAVKNGFNNVVSSITSIPGKIVSGLKDALVALFVPADDYFSNQVDSLKTELMEKLPIESAMSIIETLETASAGDMPNVEIDYMGVHATIVNFDLFKKYKPTINSWIRGFMFVLLAFYWIDQLYKMIRGTSLFSGSGRGGSPDSLDQAIMVRH